MKRRWFVVIGSVLVVLTGYLAGSGAPAGRSRLAMLLLGGGGVLILLGGYDPLPERLPWHQLVGAGVILVGATFLVLWTAPVLAGERGRDAMVLAATGLVNATILALVGVDWLLGGLVIDLDAFEPGPLFPEEEDAEAP